MALRPGAVTAHEFLRARHRPGERPVDPLQLVESFRVGQVIVITDRSFRLVAIGHAVLEGRHKGAPLMVMAGRDEYGDWTRQRNQRPAQKRSHRNYWKRRRERLRAVA